MRRLLLLAAARGAVRHGHGMQAEPPLPSCRARDVSCGADDTPLRKDGTVSDCRQTCRRMTCGRRRHGVPTAVAQPPPPSPHDDRRYGHSLASPRWRAAHFTILAYTYCRW